MNPTRCFRVLVLLWAAVAMVSAKDAVIGSMQPEIRLADGTVFTQGKILGYSRATGTATLADAKRIRTVALKDLPAPLREKLLTESDRRDDQRRIYRPDTSRPAPPADQVILPPAPVASKGTATVLDQLLQQAPTEAPDELKFYLLKAFDRVASVTCKVRKVEQVPGWQKIRVSGEAAYSSWDGSRRDYIWRTDDFEVVFEIVNGTALKPDTVSFGGISRAVGGE